MRREEKKCYGYLSASMSLFIYSSGNTCLPDQSEKTAVDLQVLAAGRKAVRMVICFPPTLSPHVQERTSTTGRLHVSNLMSNLPLGLAFWEDFTS